MTEKLAHPNYAELAEFCTSWNNELWNADNVDAFRRLSPTLTTALRQFMMEVKIIGNISAKDWFNDDGPRRGYAAAIASIFEAYQKDSEKTDKATNAIAEQLTAVQAELVKVTAELAKLKEADPAPEADKPAEDKTEEEKDKDAEEEAEKDKEEAAPTES